ncbi:MAG: M64 family metallopeptidase, partial [Sandaracinaceae bacterium]|nr:M64 family metallopeptidase [Sandaracinaceae bacterium]
MPRETFHGCGTTAHLGGAEDPRNALLVLFYPSSGWGSGNLAGFETAARAIVSDALATNEWFRDHATRLSFYAILDPTVASTGAVACESSGLGASAQLWGAGQHYWRAKGAHYGPLARGSSVEPDIYVALRSDYCDGWGNEGGRLNRQTSAVATHIVLGSRFGCQRSNDSGCPAGSRLAHEMGHALGGLADEYGRDGPCPGGEGYPNFGLPGAVPWGCHIGQSPPVACPDDAPPVRHSFLREHAPSTGCFYRRPCSDSLMRGFYGSVFQFDDVGYDAMTTGLNRELGLSLPLRLSACGAGTAGTCVPACDGVDCGLDG